MKPHKTSEFWALIATVAGTIGHAALANSSGFLHDIQGQVGIAAGYGFWRIVSKLTKGKTPFTP